MNSVNKKEEKISLEFVKKGTREINRFNTKILHRRAAYSSSIGNCPPNHLPKWHFFDHF